MGKIVRGMCNRCGQCCGLDDGIPAFPLSFFTKCQQYEESPDAGLDKLDPMQVKLYQLVKCAIGKQCKVRVAGMVFDVLVLKDESYGPRRGLVKSEDETYCPFLDVGGVPDPNAPGGLAHQCLVWGVDWQVVLCKPLPLIQRFVNQRVGNALEIKLSRFLEKHPKCGFWLEDG